MKQKLFIILIGLMLFQVSFSQKPILPDYYADPTARVFNDTLYIYPTHDEPGDKLYWEMFNWHVFSTTNMKNFYDHGIQFSLENISWANRLAWDCDVVKNNGKYWMYFSADMQIGVAVSDNPVGPWKDALGKAIFPKAQYGVDIFSPAPFIDDDGQVYLYWGANDKFEVVKMKSDMITVEGERKRFAEIGNFHEGPFVHKYKGKYYVSYCGKWKTDPCLPDDYHPDIAYSWSDSPMGPWHYGGIILQNTKSRNVQHSIVEFKNQWYLVYHVQGPNPYKRRVCVDKLYYDKEGRIIPIKMTKP